MAGAHLSLTRRALLAGACAVPALAAAVPLRHPELVSGSSWSPAGEGEDWMLKLVQHDRWHLALTAYQKAKAALAAAAHTEDEALYDRLGERHDRALQRLLFTPAPTIAALALKLDLALYEPALEFIGDEAALRSFKQDAHRLSLS